MENNCKFCSKRSSYTCPQCNAQYCSSECYKCQEHLKCSEKFYKAQVEEQLRGEYASKESKEKIQEILDKINKDEGSEGILDSDDDEDLEDRMKDIDLNDSDAVWTKLSENEKQDFLELIKNEKTADLIPPWEPWWNCHTSVTELKDEKLKHVPSFMEVCPEAKEFPPLTEVTKIEPSSDIPYNILNVLTSYVWTVRLFNGDHQENCIDATEAVFSLSPALSLGVSFSSAEIAICSPKMEAQNYSWLRESEEFSLMVKEDLKQILNGPTPNFKTYYASSALSDLHSLFISCKKALTPRKKERRGIFRSSVACYNQEIPRKFTNDTLVRSSIKKIEYFISYIKEYPYKLVIDI